MLLEKVIKLHRKKILTRVKDMETYPLAAVESDFSL